MPYEVDYDEKDGSFSRVRAASVFEGEEPEEVTVAKVDGKGKDGKYDKDWDKEEKYEDKEEKYEDKKGKN